MFKNWLLRRKFLLKILNFIGIHVPPDKKDIFHFSPRFLKFLGVLLAGFFLFVLFFIRFSTSSYFCGTCHIMKPYYKAWKESSHNFVPCVDCHYPPGFAEEFRGKIQASVQVFKYITRTYSTKPYAEIEDSSCLRKGCHAKRLLEGKVPFKEGVIFDHKPHLLQMRRGRKLRCTSCHSQIVVGSHIAVTESVCFICHFKPEDNGEPSKISKCTICHTPPEKEIQFAGISYNHSDFVQRGVECEKCHLSVVQGKGEAPKEMCLSCHGEPEKLERYNEHNFIHDVHVTSRKVECFQCHTEITHKVVTDIGILKNECSSCHVNMHDAQKYLYSGTGGKGVPDQPSVMFLAKVDCTACHIDLSGKGKFSPGGYTYKPVEAACLHCHGKEYEGILDEWKRTIDKKLRVVGNLIEETKFYVKNRDVGEVKRKLLEEAIYNYELVKWGKGVHNIEYADALLNKAEENLKKIKNE
jgi:nitrate/TMAO reductase-like tetraheme cytochrome c subunit